jgi:protein TonB
MASSAAAHIFEEDHEDQSVHGATKRPGAVRRTNQVGGRWGAIVASLVLHSAAAIALIVSPSAQDTGAVQAPTDAISVELVASAVLEQATLAETQTAAAIPAATAMTDGATSEELAASELTETVAATEIAPEAVRLATAEPSEDIDSVISGSGPEADFETVRQRNIERSKDSEANEQPAKNRPEKVERKRETAVTPDKGQAREIQAKGGVSTRGTSNAAQPGGRVSASAGAMVGYAARVRARVASNRPSVAGRGGTAVISFAVTAGGGLAYARLTRSSGTPALDQAALTAVRRSAPFPAPPAGAAARQLAFSIPFHFR